MYTSDEQPACQRVNINMPMAHTRNSLYELINNYTDAQKGSTDGTGHALYLALQAFNHMACPSVVLRLLLLLEDYEQELSELRGRS